MNLLHTRRFSNWARGHLLCRIEGLSDRFALTFDDGPGPTATPRILDLLARSGARATFFVLGSNVRRRPELVRRMHAEGHEIAIHGDRHWSPLLLPTRALLAQIERCTAAVEAVGARRPTHYRPPFGVLMPGQARSLRQAGITPVLGDVYPDDADDPGVDHIVACALKRIAGGSILILHDASFVPIVSRMQTFHALEQILVATTARGLSAVTVAGLRAAAPTQRSA